MRGYSENEDGDVVLTMSREDYDRLLMMVGMAPTTWTVESRLAFINRLNAGNPNFEPYVIEEAPRV